MPTIFLAFANNEKNHLPALREEDSGVNRSLIYRKLLGDFIVHTEQFATTGKIIDGLRQFKDDIILFHYSGHAGRGQLELEDARANADGIAALLSRCPNIKLVILNGCSTSGQVDQLLKEKTPMVIATSAPVDDRRATQFSITFFEELSQNGKTVKEAFEAAVAAAKVHGHIDFEIRSRDIGSQDTSEEARWGLYYLPANEQMINSWGLPIKQGLSTLPGELAQNLVTDKDKWLLSLRQDLLDQGVSVKNNIKDIIEHYGWIIETFLQKILTEPGREDTLRALSFMTEAYQGTLRYMCYIQMAQILQLNPTPQHAVIQSFLRLPQEEQTRYDYLNLLIILTDVLKATTTSFMPELAGLMAEINQPESDVQQAALFLNDQRRKLLNNEIPDDDSLSQLLTEYKTGLAFWLRKLAFLAKYRLVSIKDISLNYSLGTTKKFVHMYGELHGVYNISASDGPDEDYNIKNIENYFTFNQSVLLFKGADVDTCLDHIDDTSTYISLSPLVIDKSVFDDKITQTPEIYYFTGIGIGAKQYHFAHFKNELPFGDIVKIDSNKYINVKAQNNEQFKLNDLYKQLELVFQPFKKSLP